MTIPDLSIIITAKNEETTIPVVITHIHQILNKELPQLSYEILVVDDGSKDRTYNRAKHLSKNVKGLQLRKSVGPQHAWKIGLDHIKGNCTINMAADGQDCPSVIPKMISQWQKGAPIVKAKRTQRTEKGISRLLITAFYWYMARKYHITDWKDIALSDFYLLDKATYTKIKKTASLPIQDIAKAPSIRYERPPRLRERSKYPLPKKIRLGLAGLITKNNVS